MPARDPVGYSGTPLAKKLGIKAGTCLLLLDAPAGYADLFDAFPAGVRIESEPSGETAIAHVFVSRKEDLRAHLALLRSTLAADVPVWVSWPKKSARVPTDVSEDTIRELALPLGLVDIKVCAVSELWSGLKLVVRKELR